MAGLSYEDLIKEIQRLIRNLNAQSKKIDGLGERASQFAVNKFKELKQKLPKNLKQLNEKELRTLNRDLKYIRSLKSATEKGAIEAEKNYGKVQYLKNNVLTEEDINSIWNIYERISEGREGLMNNFKYEVLDTIIELQFAGFNNGEIVKLIRNTFDKSQVAYLKPTQIEKDRLFINLLDDISNNPFDFEDF